MVQMLEHLMMDEIHGLKTHYNHQCSSGCYGIHASSRSHTDGRSHPQAGCCSESFYCVFLENDTSGTNETYATDHLSSQAAWVALYAGHSQKLVEAVHGENHKQSATQTNKEMCTETSFLRTVFTLEANDATKHGSYENAKNKLTCHFFERSLRELRGVLALQATKGRAKGQ